MYILLTFRLKNYASIVCTYKVITDEPLWHELYSQRRNFSDFLIKSICRGYNAKNNGIKINCYEITILEMLSVIKLMKKTYFLQYF